MCVMTDDEEAPMPAGSEFQTEGTAMLKPGGIGCAVWRNQQQISV